MPEPMRKPADHHERLEVARDVARFEIGDPSWADLIIRVYLQGHAAEEDLE